MTTYFAVDLDKRKVVSEEGERFTAEQFKKIIERNAAKDVFFDMTMSTARFILDDYDWDKLEDYYKEVDKLA